MGSVQSLVVAGEAKLGRGFGRLTGVLDDSSGAGEFVPTKIEDTP